MSVVGDAVRGVGRTVGRAATATTMAAGAVGEAAVDGAVGAVRGAAAGVQRGLGHGSRSTPAAALTLGVLGATGLVEWPLVLVVGGGALLWRQLNRQSNTAALPAKSAPAGATASTDTDSPKNSEPAKKRATSAAKQTSARRPRSSAQSRSRGRQ